MRVEIWDQGNILQDRCDSTGVILQTLDEMIQVKYDAKADASAWINTDPDKIRPYGTHQNN